MREPYIFGHRGGMGLCIENTIECFRNAINLGVGIETDIQLTKDGHLVCFHDYVIKINSINYDIANLNYKDLSKIQFSDKRKIPKLDELFSLECVNPDIRYSFDIRNSKVGKKLIDVAKKHELLNRIEITDRRISLLSTLRKYNASIRLIYTVPENIIKISNVNIKFEKLKRVKVSALNLRSHRVNVRNFREIYENQLDCYVWALNYKNRARRILNLREKDQRVAAIYTDYPDMILDIQAQIT